MTRNHGRNARLRAHVYHGKLVIEIGVDTLATAALASPYAWQLADEHTGAPGETRPDELYSIHRGGPGFDNDGSRGFAKDVVGALLDEREDGSSLLTDVIDAATKHAIEYGSVYFHGPEDE